ncbi:hypothetical protein ACVXHB_09920 [Escherichia coli]
MTGIGQYELLGESIDDAAGEAFDKPRSCWGWIILAGRYCRKWRLGYCRALCLPASDDRPSGLDFSFSGLKTFAANTIRDNGTDDQTRADIARALKMRWSIR